jgi:prepilin peptidase CpaA
VSINAFLLGLFGPGVLTGLLTLAVWHDLVSFRIPNALIVSGFVLALLMHALVPGGLGLAQSLAGAGVGLAGLLPFYLARAMGAGDVKLLAMIGAFVGPLDAFGCVLGTYLVGMALALAVAMYAGVVRKALRNLRLAAYATIARLASVEGPAFDPLVDTAARLPYTLAIALGTAGFFAWKLM